MGPPSTQTQGRSSRVLNLLGTRSLVKTTLLTGLVLLALSTIWLSRDAIAQGSSAAFVTGLKDRLTGGQSPDRPLKVTSHSITPKIWQIMLAKKDTNPKDPVDRKVIEDATSWLSLNRDYEFTLVGSNGANEFLQRYYAEKEPEIVRIFNDFVNVGMKSDLLRYLLLDKIGGVYTDTDTIAVRPIDDWVPEELRDKVRVIIGIEWDQQGRGAVKTIPHIVQFCQWTIAAAPGHPVFRRMVNRIVGAVDALEAKHGKPLAQIEPEFFDVLNTTGPALWTDAVFEQLQEYNSSLTDTKDFSYLAEPVLVGDMLILAINGFGMGQSHSGSVHDGSTPEQALIRHRFRGSWRGEKQG